MSISEQRSIVGFHAFTGNDYISLFFRKSKEHCWKILQSNHEFNECFESLGRFWTLSPQLLTSHVKKTLDSDIVHHTEPFNAHLLKLVWIPLR